MGRKLINYFPEVLRNYREFQKTFEAEEPEFENLQDELSKVLKDFFVEDATERGVRRWEKVLKIVPKPGENLEDRKFKILSKLVKKLPYTRRRLEQLLEMLCGENGYSLEIMEGTTNLCVPAYRYTNTWTTIDYAWGRQTIIDCTEGDIFTISADIRNLSQEEDQRWAQVAFHDSGGIKLKFYNAMGSGMSEQRLSFTTPPAPIGTVEIRVYWVSDGDGFSYQGKNFQIEKKPYNTPFVDGTRLYNYTVKVQVALSRKNMFDDIKILLQEIIPANHILDLSLLYSQHFIVGQYKHGELSTWTHDYIRSEVLNQ